MKELNGSAYSAVDAPPDKCMALLEAVDRYPEWHPEVVKEVELLASNDDVRPRAVGMLRRAEVT